MMALDGFGNYYAKLPDPLYAPFTGNSSVSVGVGAPNTSTPIAPFYIDSSTGNIYSNATLTSTGWVLSSGGSGTTQVLHGSGSPIANSVPTSPVAIYINDSDSTIWAVVGGVWTQEV